MRQIASEQVDKVAFARKGGSDGTVFKSYRVSLLTPLLGGDTESWVPNRERPIRVPAIKGQLRFWWRTMQESMDRKELLAREGRVWGATGNASPVSLGVSYATAPVIRVVAKNERGILESNEYPKYVLFPLQGQEEVSFDIIHACEFSLTVTCDAKVWPEVERTLRLWVLFGGVGGRTRRGAGSLFCPQLTNVVEGPEQIAAFVGECRRGQQSEFGTSPWPRLADARLAIDTTGETDPIAAWKKFLDEYGNFRQGRGIGRGNGQGNRPGRSFWPEPDALRRITGESAANHVPEHPAGNWFPRAAYGMPVQTEFRNAAGDPRGKYMLQPENAERWPSPLLLKVIRSSETSGLLRCALVLNAKIPERLVVIKDKRNIHDLHADEMPLATTGKCIPKMPAFAQDSNPYSAVIRHLNLKEVL